MFPPRRIVCLTEETVETLYLLGQQDRIAGISGYVVRPPEARRDKPRISSFLSADLPKILTLNQRSVVEILDMVRLLGAMVGEGAAAEALARRLEEGLAAAKERAASLPKRPRVYFEEWDEPMISGIAWVSELIEAAGGIDVFPEKSRGKSASERIVTPEQVIAAEPDIIVGSWCGKKLRPEKVALRPGFESIPAVRDGRIHEIKAPLILQPGPAALTEGLAALEAVIHSWSRT